MFQITIPLLEGVDKINFKSNAEEFTEKPYEFIEENPHFKTIYFVTIYKDIFVTVGIDRKITFWRYNSDTIIQDFCINCLGGKVNKIIKNNLERQYSIL